VFEHIIAFVPARGGSSRLKRKNLQLIGSLPLFLRACYNLHQVLPKSNIVVDSDDDEILNIAEDHGFKTLKRPDELATNQTDGNSFFRWETSNFPNYQIYIQHLPPMPFLSKNTILSAIEIINQGFDSIVPVAIKNEYQWDFEKSMPLYDLENIPNSFTLNKSVIETMGFYVITNEAHQKFGRRIGEKYKFLEISKIEQIDIDYMEDLEVAQAIERGLDNESLYKSHVLRYQKDNSYLNIKLIISDVDGVLTDGKMIYSEDGNEMKNFNTKDGIGAYELKRMGYKIVFLSSGTNNKIIQKRGNHLKIDHVDVGVGEKKERLLKILDLFKISPEETLYIGDDINDLEAMKLCSIKACPINAHSSIKDISDIILTTNGGDGCLREIYEILKDKI
jgi:YrbI family 3-deoxy-D-manno-octulosonate 8-phosphate phosphatase